MFWFADKPGKPQIKDIKEQGCNVTVEWSKPPSNGCPILFYTIRYKQQKQLPDDKEWTEMNVTDPRTDQQELILNCATTYEFEVLAVNEIGRSDASKVRSATTEGKLSNFTGLSLESILKIVFTVTGLALFAVLLAIGAWHYGTRKQHRTKR